MKLTRETLKMLLRYDPKTGIFRWRVDSPNALLGTIAGRRHRYDGHIEIGINNEKYQASQLAFLYITGSMLPEGIIHINGNNSDNRFCNLRRRKILTVKENLKANYLINKLLQC